MEITARSFWTVLYGMGFGALYLLACSGALIELYRFTTPSESAPTSTRFLNAYLITMVAFVFIRYGRDLKNHRPLRAAVLAFAIASFLSAGIAGFFGAMINKAAPINGGHAIQLTHGEAK